jgi:predicted AlkP superfamily phosphohydrolase/phosphomutase
LFGHSYFVQINEVLDDREKYADLVAALDDDRFILKAEYHADQKYLEDIKLRQKEVDDDFDELFDN